MRDIITMLDMIIIDDTHISSVIHKKTSRVVHHQWYITSGTLPVVHHQWYIIQE